MSTVESKKIKKVLQKSLVVLATIPLIVVACQGSKSGKSLVKVGSQSITQDDLDTLARVNPRLKPRLETPEGRGKILENYVEQEMLYQESINRGLNRSQDVKDKIALYDKILVAQALLDDELDKKVKEYYENHKDEFERVKVSDIFIKTASTDEAPKAAEEAPAKDAKKDAKKGAAKEVKKAEKLAAPAAGGHSDAAALKLAQDAKERVSKGDDFGKVAKEISEDDRSKNSMGDLGYITIHDKRLERWGWLPVAEKAFGMKMGEVSDPIKTKDGYHIIKITEEKKMQPYEESEAGIRFRLQADIRTQLLEDLKKKYKVEYAKSEAAGQKPDGQAPGTPSTPGANGGTPPPATPPTPGNPGAGMPPPPAPPPPSAPVAPKP